MVLIKGYSDFVLAVPNFLKSGAASFPDAKLLAASFKLDTDVSRLFPYINAVVEDAVFYETPNHIRFTLDGYRCGVYPESVTALAFDGREEALWFAERLIDFLNDLYSRIDSIKPNHEKYQPLSIVEILKILPRTNCQKCGFPTCMTFAVALNKRTTDPYQCPGLADPMTESAVYPIYDNDGNLVSTVSLDLSASKTKSELDRQQEHIKDLEGSLTREAGEEGGASTEESDNGQDFGLTDREIEVLELVAEGCTNIEISSSLSISPHTVKSHVIHIFNKLGVSDRTQAAVLATRCKVI